MRTGLTLIELIVALTIFAVLGTALVVTLRNGIAAWQAVEATSRRQQRWQFACDRLQRDVAHAVRLTNDSIPQSWTATALQVVTAQRDRDDIPRLVRVALEANRQQDGSHALLRRSAPYPASLELPWQQEHTMLTGAASLVFEYLYLDASGAPVWQPVWDAEVQGVDAIPRALRLRVTWAQPPLASASCVAGIPTGSVGKLEGP